MGRGDKKTKRGKISRGSYGVRRPRIKKRVTPETKIEIDKKVKP
ncbi:30S ribosomal protein THX [Bizionia saleffrena]|uniref:30S ribosomal protein THX n=1 Tax=Bizionia saleffrena TaxID=291189 RepID=A0A8H2LF72_9FLAO|nr:30S ribosomal protein THX [Bizionia saleffrena]TYB74427.1 30S ribosomal protein THX [Bizionia saleffrena]